MSISTQIPTGLIHPSDRCIAPLYDFAHWSDPNPTFFSCADFKNSRNASLNLKDSDFQAFCCKGGLLGSHGWLEAGLDFKDLECCVYGAQVFLESSHEGEGLKCTGRGRERTPLASLAATGTAEATPFVVTYQRGSRFVSEVIDDYTVTFEVETVATEVPYCLWVDTVHGVQVTSVQVPAASVTAVPRTGSAETSARATTGSSLESGSAGETPLEGVTSGSGTGAAGPEPTGASNTLSVPAVMCLGLVLASWVL